MPLFIILVVELHAVFTLDLQKAGWQLKPYDTHAPIWSFVAESGESVILSHMVV